MIRIGTSGYNYPEWRGTFYPEKFPTGKMLPYYAERFSTVEINYTFYRMPNAKTIAGWDAETPPGFSFTLKAPQRITHIARRRLRIPSCDGLGVGHPVERVVDLHRGKAFRVVRQHLAGGELLRIESASPLRVVVARRADANHGDWPAMIPRPPRHRAASISGRPTRSVFLSYQAWFRVIGSGSPRGNTDTVWTAACTEPGRDCHGMPGGTGFRPQRRLDMLTYVEIALSAVVILVFAVERFRALPTDPKDGGMPYRISRSTTTAASYYTAVSLYGAIALGVFAFLLLSPQALDRLVETAPGIGEAIPPWARQSPPLLVALILTVLL